MLGICNILESKDLTVLGKAVGQGRGGMEVIHKNFHCYKLKKI
jgi:hypothetical protein